MKNRDLYFEKARTSMIKQLWAMNAFAVKEGIQVSEGGISPVSPLQLPAEDRRPTFRRTMNVFE